MRKLIGSVLALGTMLGLAVRAPAAPLNFRVTLTEAQEVPSPDSIARGTATFRFDPGLGVMHYDLRVTNGVAVTQAHLHCANSGINGPVVVFLFGPANPGQNVNGLLATGNIGNSDLIATSGDPCNTTINNVASLYQAILDGHVYVNVHTEANPGGEIRSQLFP
jgi:hypothetical protein